MAGFDVESVRGRLLALRRRVAAAMAVDGAARTAGALLAVVAVSFLLDRFFKLEAAARAVLLLLGLGALGWVVWRTLVRRLRHVPGEDPLAVAVERRFPKLGDRLLSALQLSRETEPERWGMSPALIEDAIAEAAEPVARVRFLDVIASGRVARTGLLGLVALVLLGGGAAADPASASIWFRRNVLLQEVRWPQKTWLEVDPERFPDGVARVVRGSDLVVTARSTGEVHPERVTILWADSEGQRGRATMKADLRSRLYRHEFAEIAFPLTFHLEGGDDVTDEFAVELMEPPEVEDLRVVVSFPEYAGREPLPVDLALGDPEVLRGGAIAVSGRSTKPLESAALVVGDLENETVTARLLDGQRFEVTWTPRETALLGVRLRDTDGLSNPSLAPRFLVRVSDDRAPQVRLLRRGIGTLVVTGAVLPYTVRIRDDVRAVSGHIEVQRMAGDREAAATTTVPLPDDRLGEPSIEIDGELEIAELKASPGAFLTFTAVATDNAPEPHEGRSDPITVKVVTLEELLNDLLRRQQEQRRLFEELILREERLEARFLDLRDRPPASPGELADALEGQGQEQREIARRVRGIERELGQVLDEMLHNRIYEPGSILELRNKVVEPLVRLRERVLPGHAGELERASRRAAALDLRGVDGDGLADGYKDVLAAMRAALAQMEKIEGFSEIVERVRTLLDLQKQLREATRKAYEKALGEFADPPPDDGGR